MCECEYGVCAECGVWSLSVECECMECGVWSVSVECVQSVVCGV